MKRWVIFILLMVTGVVTAQNTATYQLDDATINLAAPLDWTVIASAGSIEVSASSGYGQLFRYNILNDCGGQSPDPAVPNLSCNPTALETLNYFMPVVWGYDVDASAKQMETVDGIDYVNTGAYYAGVKSTGNGIFLVFVWQPGDPDNALRADIQALLASAFEAGFAAESAAPADLPVPVTMPDGWTLDIARLKASIIARIIPGADGLIYAYTNKSVLVVLDDNGTVQRVLENTALDGLRDFAVTSDGTLWTLGQPPLISQVDASGEFVQTLDVDTGDGYVVLAIEPDSRGKLYLLEQSPDSARVVIVDTTGKTTGGFDISAGDFLFQGEPFLSNASFAVAPSGHIYVYSEWSQAVREFDADGTIITPALPVDLTGYVTDYSFDGQGQVYLHVRDSAIVPVYDTTTGAADSVKMPASIFTVLPSGDVLSGDETMIARQNR